MGLALDSSGLRTTSGNTKLSAERIKECNSSHRTLLGGQPIFHDFSASFFASKPRGVLFMNPLLRSKGLIGMCEYTHTESYKKAGIPHSELQLLLQSSAKSTCIYL